MTSGPEHLDLGAAMAEWDEIDLPTDQRILQQFAHWIDEHASRAGARQRAMAAAADVCWKATPYGTTQDGDVAAYILPKGCVHRLVGALQGAGFPAALREFGVPEPSDDT
jgi:hypothetical protein